MVLAACNALTGVNDLEIISGAGGSENDASAGSAGSSMGGSAGQDGAAGQGGVGGQGGIAGQGGEAGDSSAGGAVAGGAGDAGNAGTGATGQGGESGQGGAAGQGGIAGQGGAAGSGGTCDTGKADCNATPGCETTINANDKSNCGACGKTCLDVNSVNACTAGVCTPQCAAGFMSCDGDNTDGCERKVAYNPLSCWDCTLSCALRERCGSTPEKCLKCAPGKWDCNQDPVDGCERDCLVGCEGPNKCGRVEAITAGGAHACAILTVGILTCWGANTAGELGDGDVLPSLRPKKILDSGVARVAAGFNFTCAIVNGDVKCWGSNDKGQLGFTGSAVFDAHNAKTILSNATMLAAGSWQAACAAVNTGKVYCWGENYGGVAPVEITGVMSPSAMAVGTEHACAVVGTGINCWGRNSAGQFGNGSTSTVITYEAVPIPLASSAWTLIGAGDYHSLGGMPSAPRAWGGNGDGQLGVGDTSTHSAPTPIANLLGVDEETVELKGGFRHSCAIVRNTSSGLQRVKCWGSSSDGKVGLESVGNPSAPVKVTWTGVALQASSLAVGWEFSCALMPSGDKVACWGRGDAGQLGDGNTYPSGSGDAKLVNFAY